MIEVTKPITSQVILYIEPGTLTMIIQVLIAGAIAGLFMLKTFWGRVKLFLTKLFRKDND